MICIPIRAKTENELKNKIKKAHHYADIIEIWLDQFISTDFKKITQLTNKPLIAVIKSKSEGGSYLGSQTEKINCLKNALFAGFSYLDIPIQTPSREIISLIASKPKHTRLILSYHNFKSTPSLPTLKKICLKALALRADVIKIATQITDIPQNLILFDLISYVKNKYGKDIIVIGMGKNGIFSRIFAPYLGSYLTFVSLDQKSKTAPGQLTINEYNLLQKILCP